MTLNAGIKLKLPKGINMIISFDSLNDLTEVVGIFEIKTIDSDNLYPDIQDK